MPRTTVKQVEGNLHKLERKFKSLCKDVSGTCRTMEEDSNQRMLDLEHIRKTVNILDDKVDSINTSISHIWADIIRLRANKVSKRRFKPKRTKRYKKRGLLRRVYFKLYSGTKYTLRKLI